MKKYILHKFILVFGLVSILSSCSEDFLEILNPNEQPLDSFWRNNADLNSGLTTVYHALASDNVLSLAIDNHRSDISYPGFNRLQSSNRFYNQTFNDGDPNIANKWESLYAIIFRANQVITNGERLIGSYTDEDSIIEGTQIVAQARFLRGWAYFTLYWMFNEGSVVIYDFVPEDESEFFQPLSDAASVRELLIGDLTYARENLPPRWTEPGDLGRVSAGTATAVLGKQFLYESNYNDAAEMFTDVITNGDYGYRLMQDIGDNFSEAGEYNAEAIFEIGYSVTEKDEFGGFDFRNVSNNFARQVAPAGAVRGFRSILPSAWLAVLYKNEVIDTVDPRNTIDSVDIAGLPVLDDDENPIPVLRRYSLRTSASIALPDDFVTPYYQGDIAAQKGQFNNLEYAYFRKYSNWQTVESETDFQPENKSPINTRMIRLADVYLMLAESLIAGGTNEAGVEEALVLVNEVRRRSGVRLLGLNGTGLHPANDHDNISYTAQSLMNHIMFVERPLELALEGQALRFLDLRRWNVLQERFLDLSSRSYYVDNVDFITSMGENATKFGSAIFEGAINPNTGEPDTRIKDHVRASENYNPVLHDFYPIPNEEKLANPNIN